MTRLLALLALTTPGPAPASAAEPEARVFELRTYTASAGKLEALQARMRDHADKALARHDITAHGYFVPLDNKANQLVVIVSHANAKAREANWKAFGADQEWMAAAKESDKDGKLMEKVDVTVMALTDYSPDPAKFAASEKERVYELRTYVATPNNLGHLNDRFRNHTIKLFEKYGMQNFAYWNTLNPPAGEQPKLVYLLAHASDEARKKSFDEFRKDAAWNAAREASEKLGGGSLTAKDGVQSLTLKPLPFSKLK